MVQEQNENGDQDRELSDQPLQSKQPQKPRRYSKSTANKVRLNFKGPLTKLQFHYDGNPNGWGFAALVALCILFIIAAYLLIVP